MSTNQQAEKLAAPVLYTYDKATGEYKPDRTSTSQWSPRENKWLIPACATTTEPPAAEDKKARCWNAESRAWEQKPDHRGEKWYDKATRELHEIKDIGAEPDESAWTQAEPKDLESVWDEGTSAWVIPPEVQERRDVAAAESQATALLDKQQRIQAAQTMTFSAPEFRLLAKAKYFNTWQPNTHYDKGKRLLWNGVVYEVRQEGGIDSLENYPPDGEGLLAVYQPLSVDSETGESHAGTLEDPIPWAYGIKIEQGKYYLHNGKTWYAIQPQNEALWEPGSQGTEALWKEVNTEA